MVSPVVLLAVTLAAAAAPDFQPARIDLKRATFDPLGEPLAVTTAAAPATLDTARLAIVQFAEPCRPEWLRELAALGVRPIGPVHHYGYLVAATGLQLGALAGLPHVRWTGPYRPEYKQDEALDPLTASHTAAATAELLVQITDAFGPVDQTLAALRAIGVTVRSRRSMGAFETCAVTVPAGRVAELAGWPAVLWIEPAPVFELFGERACQIQAGALDIEGQCAAGPGYAERLANWGVDGTGVIVQIQDSGVDREETASGHPDLREAVVGFFNATHDSSAGDAGGHGTINAGIVAGRSVVGTRDRHGYLLGQGAAPGAAIYNTKIFDNGGAFDISFWTLSDLASDAQRHGAQVSNNSWGCPGCANTYVGNSQEVDLLVRDADLLTPGNQPLCFVFSAGNSGPGTSSVRPPGTAKNDITVGASQNCDADGADGCGLAAQWADQALGLAPFSSRGPASDNRLEPTLVSVGTHVQGPASTFPNFVGDGVCDAAWPPDQSDYARSSGTSHSAPMVAGAAALFIDFHRQRTGTAPSPALIKAALVDACVDLAGGRDGNGGTIGPAPDVRQGWGRPNLERLLDRREARIYHDQTHIFTRPGETFELDVAPVDSDRPVTVTLVWTDAPGMLWNRRALTNDLDLEVLADGEVYRGNRMVDGRSVPGGGPDWLNNLERVVLDTDGELRVRITSSDLAGDGVPGNDEPLDQDFALVIRNAHVLDARTIALDRSVYGCDATVGITLTDASLRGAGSLAAQARTEPDGAAAPVALVETPPGSGRFRGTLALGAGGWPVRDGDRLRVAYAEVSAEATVDCAPPGIVGPVETRFDPQRNELVVRWRTDEAATSLVHLGQDCAALEIVYQSDALTYGHVAVLHNLDPVAAYRVAVASRDAAGNARESDPCLPAAPWVEACAFRHTIDSGTDGWRSDWPWEIAVEDSNAFWRLGTLDEQQEAPFSRSVVTPPFDLTRLVAPTLVFRQRHALDYRTRFGLVEASTDEAAWSSYLTLARGARPDWHTVAVDLAQFAGLPSVRLRFRLLSQTEQLAGTLHIDDVFVCERRALDARAALTTDSAVYPCNGTINLRIADANAAPSVVLTSALTGDRESAALAASGDPNLEGLYTGAMPLARGNAAADGRLQVADGDVVRLEYADDAGPATAEVRVDCRPPAIGAVRIDAVRTDGFTVHWETDETAGGTILVGTGCGFYETAVDTVIDATRHELRVTGLAPDRPYFVALEAVDAAGNRARDDHRGKCYTLRTRFEVAVHDDGAPGALEGWTAEAPWGRTRERAATGDDCWTDSPYRIAFRNVDASLVSPVFDLEGLVGTRLVFWQAYDLGGEGDHVGRVEVSTDGGATWSAPLLENKGQRTAWHEVDLDLAMLDGSPNARVRFHIVDPPAPTARIGDGWYVDGVRVLAAEPRTGSGILAFDRERYACDALVTLRLADTDLLGLGNVAVLLWAVFGGETLGVTLHEDPPDSGVFTGSVRLGADLLVTGGERLLFGYTDDEDEEGETVLVQATADIDCEPPDVRIDAIDVLGRAARVTVRVSEQADVVLHFGTRCDQLTRQVEQAGVAAQTTLVLPQLLPYTRYYVRAQATDRAGNTAWSEDCSAFVTPRDERLKLTEVGFARRALELENGSGTDVWMGGWTVQWTVGERGRGTFAFPEGFVFGAGRRLVIHNTNLENDEANLYRGGFGWQEFETGSVALIDPQGKGADFVRWNGSAAAPAPGTAWSAPEVPVGILLAANLGRAPDAADTDTGADWYPVPPSLGEPNDVSTPTPTLPPTETPTPDPDETLVETYLLSGDPFQRGGRFEVGARIANNRMGPVGTYWIELVYDPSAVEARDLRDGGLGGTLVFNRNERGTVNVLGVNSSSTLENGTFFVLTFEVRETAPDAYAITARDFAGNDIYSTAFQRIPHVYDWRGTVFAQGTPTQTPTGPTHTPSCTPTRTPTPTFTDTPDALGARLVSELVGGDPCTAGATFEVGVRLLGNQVGRLGSYAVALSRDAARTSFVGVRDGGAFGVAPANGFVFLEQPGVTAQAFSAFNALSTFHNGLLFVATFRVEQASPGPYDMALFDYGPTALVTTAFQQIPHRLDGSGTRFCRPPPPASLLRVH